MFLCDCAHGAANAFRLAAIKPRRFNRILELGLRRVRIISRRAIFLELRGSLLREQWIVARSPPAIEIGHRQRRLGSPRKTFRRTQFRLLACAPALSQALPSV